MLVVSPEHARLFAAHGWNKARLRRELEALLLLDGDEIARGAGGIEEGMPAAMVAGQKVPKFLPGELSIVHAGGQAGLFSAIIEGWVAGARGSQLTTREVRS
jgi:hypothetical protein